MLNGQNAFNAGGGPGPGGGGFPAMQTQAQTQAQYGVGPGQRVPAGPGAGQRGAFPGQMGPGGVAGGVGMGAQGGMQSPFSPGPPMGQGGGQRLSLDGRGGGAGGAPPGLQRQSSGGMPLVGARPAGPGAMGGAGAFPRPPVAGSQMGAGAGVGGADLLAMINKQQHGGANLAAFGGGGSHFAGMGGGLGRDEGAAPPGFDLNDFPSLGGPQAGGAGGGLPGARGGHGMGPFGNGMGVGGGFANPGAGMSGGLFGGMDGMGGADGYGVVSLQKPHPEFQMQTEDFPALPGAPGMGSIGGKGGGGLGGVSLAPGANFPPAQRGGGGGGGFPGLGGVPKPGGEGYPGANGAAYTQGPGPAGAQGPARAFGGAGGAHDGAGDEAGARGAASAEVDRFGLLGLLGVIRMSDPDVTTLALGTDLTTLGLNLNSPEPLYKTFGSPWSDAPPRHELELALPACYSVRARALHKSAFAKFQQETLFYVFYSMPGDESQLFAADELVARGWGFHKELKAWLSRVAGTEPVQKTERGERGSFWIFDAGAWDRVRKDNFNLQYDQLEVRPAVKRDAPGSGARAQKGATGDAGGALLVGAE